MQCGKQEGRDDGTESHTAPASSKRVSGHCAGRYCGVKLEERVSKGLAKSWGTHDSCQEPGD